MLHFEEHPYACIKNNKVDNVITFNSHDENLINLIKNDFQYDDLISLCDYGQMVSPLYSYDSENKTFYLDAEINIEPNKI